MRCALGCGAHGVVVRSWDVRTGWNRKVLADTIRGNGMHAQVLLRALPFRHPWTPLMIALSPAPQVLRAPCAGLDAHGVPGVGVREEMMWIERVEMDVTASGRGMEYVVSRMYIYPCMYLSIDVTTYLPITKSVSL